MNYERVIEVMSQYKTTTIRNYMASHFFFLSHVSFLAHQTRISACTVCITKQKREFDGGEGSSSCLLRPLHSYCVTDKQEGQNHVFRRNLYPSARVVCPPEVIRSNVPKYFLKLVTT